MIDDYGRPDDYSRTYGRRSGGNAMTPQPHLEYLQFSNARYQSSPYGSPPSSTQPLSQSYHTCWPPRGPYQHLPPPATPPPIEPPLQRFPYHHQAQIMSNVPPPSNSNAVHSLNADTSFRGQQDPRFPQPFSPPVLANFQRKHSSDHRSSHQSQMSSNGYQNQPYQPQSVTFQTPPPVNLFEQQQPPYFENPYPGNQEPWLPLPNQNLPLPSSSSSDRRSTTPSTPPSRNSSRRSSFKLSSFDDDNRALRRPGHFRSPFRDYLEHKRVASPVNSKYRPDDISASRPDFRNQPSHRSYREPLPRAQREDSRWAGQVPRALRCNIPQNPSDRPPPPSGARRARYDLDLPEPSSDSVFGRIRDTGTARSEQRTAEGREWKRQRRGGASLG